MIFWESSALTWHVYSPTVHSNSPAEIPSGVTPLFAVRIFVFRVELYTADHDKVSSSEPLCRMGEKASICKAVNACPRFALKSLTQATYSVIPEKLWYNDVGFSRLSFSLLLAHFLYYSTLRLSLLHPCSISPRQPAR